VVSRSGISSRSARDNLTPCGGAADQHLTCDKETAK
jgi:hypothetical protein